MLRKVIQFVYEDDPVSGQYSPCCVTWAKQGLVYITKEYKSTLVRSYLETLLQSTDLDIHVYLVLCFARLSTAYRNALRKESDSKRFDVLMTGLHNMIHISLFGLNKRGGICKPKLITPKRTPKHMRRYRYDRKYKTLADVVRHVQDIY